MIPTNSDFRVEVATKCNYNCIICPHDKLERPKELMSNELFQLVFDKVMTATDQYTTLTFPGMGEPLLDPRLTDKIRYARAKRPDLQVMILTNGSLLTPERFAAFEELGVTSVRVSFYGNTAESYSRIMGVKNKNMFHRVESNLEEICRRKKTTKLLMTMNIIDETYDVVTQDWIDFWKDRVDLLEVWRPHNWGASMNFRKVQPEKLKTCGRPFQGPLQVQVDGTVNMCCFDYDGKLTFGDLKTQGLQEIFETPFFRKIYHCHQTGDYTGCGLICENCDQRNKDKSDVMVYNSKFDIQQRVKQISTTYKVITDIGQNEAAEAKVC